MSTVEQALEFGVKTDPGMVRTNNEDAILVEPGLGLAILADGMGGGNAGEVASGMATTLLANDLKQTWGSVSPSDVAGIAGRTRAFTLLKQKIAIANESIFHAAEHQPQYAGMGTTLVVALFYDNRVAVAHIGDSRLYRLRGGSLQQLTKDHSLLQMQIDSGVITREDAKHSKQKNIVTRALGVEAQVEAEIHEHDVRQGDVYVLCSDDLHDMIEEGDIVKTLSAPGVKLDAAAKTLVQKANDNGGKDNVSVILVKARGDFRPPKGWWQRLLAWLK